MAFLYLLYFYFFLNFFFGVIKILQMIVFRAQDATRSLRTLSTKEVSLCSNILFHVSLDIAWNSYVI